MGGPGFEVEMADMDLLGQVFERQHSHMQAIGSYVQGSCSASGAFTGVMSLLQGKYTPAHQTAVTGYGQGTQIAEACQTKIIGTKDDLVAADRRQYEAMRAHNPDLPPYTEPGGDPVLGPPGETVPAPSDDPSAWEKFQEAVERGKRPLDSAAAIAGHDPWDPAGHERAPSDPSVSDRTDPGYWAKRGIDRGYEYLVDKYYERQAANDPGGRSGADLRQQAGINDGYRYESAHGAGRQFMYDHTNVVDPGHRPGTAWPSDSMRGGLSSFADNLGKANNIANAVPQLVDAGNNLNDARDLQQDMSDAANGPSNSGDSAWANESRGNSW